MKTVVVLMAIACLGVILAIIGEAIETAYEKKGKTDGVDN